MKQQEEGEGGGGGKIWHRTWREKREGNTTQWGKRLKVMSSCHFTNIIIFSLRYWDMHLKCPSFASGFWSLNCCAFWQFRLFCLVCFEKQRLYGLILNCTAHKIQATDDQKRLNCRDRWWKQRATQCRTARLVSVGCSDALSSGVQLTTLSAAR